MVSSLRLSDSLYLHPCPGGEIGRRTVFRWQHPKGCAGSNPVPGTKPLAAKPPEAVLFRSDASLLAKAEK